MKQSQVRSVLSHRVNARFSSRPAEARFIRSGAECASEPNLVCKFDMAAHIDCQDWQQ